MKNTFLHSSILPSSASLGSRIVKAEFYWSAPEYEGGTWAGTARHSLYGRMQSIHSGSRVSLASRVSRGKPEKMLTATQHISRQSCHHSTQSRRMFQRTPAFHTQETELATENGGQVMEGWQGLSKSLSPLCNAVGEFTKTQEKCDSWNLKWIFLGRNQIECCLLACCWAHRGIWDS